MHWPSAKAGAAGSRP